MNDMKGETSFATYDEKRIDEFARDVTAFQKKIEEQKRMLERTSAQIAALQASLEHETQRAQAAIQERDEAHKRAGALCEQLTATMCQRDYARYMFERANAAKRNWRCSAHGSDAEYQMVNEDARALADAIYEWQEGYDLPIERVEMKLRDALANHGAKYLEAQS